MKIKEKFIAWWRKKHEKTPIEKRIEELTDRMSYYDEFSEEYKSMAENLKVLTEANALFKENKKGLDKNVIFTGLVSFGQVILILIWEERHVIRSEAIKFVTKIFKKN